MKIIILLFSISLIIFLISCYYKKSNEQKRIIEYGTKEFEVFVKKAAIKPEKAWEIHFRELKKKNPEVSEKDQLLLYICVNDDYLFSTFSYPKMNEVSFSGFYINSKTGKAVYKDVGSKNYSIKNMRGSMRHYPFDDK